MSWRRLPVHVFLIAVCAGLSLAGSALAVSAFARTTEEFALGSLRVSVAPATSGSVDVYVPIVDWGVRAAPFDAPLALDLQFRSLDRDAARGALRSGASAEATLERLADDLAVIARRALSRAGVLALAGGIVGGILAGGFAAGILHRRRWFAFGAVAGLVVPLSVAAFSYSELRTADYDAFDRPTFYAHGSELPRLLSFSEQIFEAGESYTRSYEQAFAGLANLIAFASERPAPAVVADSAVVASDLHLNTLVLPVLKDYTRGKTLFFVGDFTLLGTVHESSLAQQIGDLSGRVVAVSGNHDSRPFMLELVRSGVLVLTRDGRLQPDGGVDGRPVVEVEGATVAGFDDPLERPTDDVAAHDLELEDEELARASDEIVAWFEQLPERPDVVLVHQHALAHALLDALETDDGDPVVILTGHDHEQHLERQGAHVLVDGGTVGAGGPFAIGEQRVGLAELGFAEGRLRAVDLIEVEPLSGEGTARRVVLDAGLPGAS